MRGRQRLSESKLSADAALLDPVLLQRALLFYGHTCSLQLRQMGARAGHLPERVSDTFRALPEWYIEDIAEFLLFLLQLVRGARRGEATFDGGGVQNKKHGVVWGRAYVRYMLHMYI